MSINNKKEKNYSREVISEFKYPNEQGKVERFVDEYGTFYKESIFDGKNCLEVTYEFSYDGYYESIFSFINIFAYYLGYTGKIDDDLKMISCYTAFEDYEIDNYLLRYRDKNNTLFSIRSDIEIIEMKIGMTEGAIASNADYYDDSVVEAFERFKRRRGWL